MRGYLNMLFGSPSPRSNSRSVINSGNAVQVSQGIAASNMSTQEKMDALHTARTHIHGNENLTLDQQDLALAHNIIESERVAAQAGNISWAEFYQYERDARQDVEQRIATRHALRSGL